MTTCYTRLTRSHRNVNAAFNLLPKKDLEAVVDYILVLSQRGELEYQLGI